jgi:23S rRNA (cytosine1962-C5)-methyltransferase
MAVIWLKSGREKSVRLRHPWIFSGAIDHLKGDPQPGETVEVCSSTGEWLAWAAYSPFSQIRGRIWSWDARESIDANFIRARLAQALNMRKALVPAEETNALRLVHGESDGLPGVVIDRYGSVLVLQILSAGAEAWRDALVNGLVELTGLEQVYERSDVDVRSLEGLPERTGSLHGAPPPERLVIRENGLDFKVDICAGQKTGFYLDQRRNRQRVGALVSGRKVLNCFCYTGAFSVYALAGGAASVLSIDSSADAMALAAENVALNGFPAEKVSWLEGDVFHELRRLRDRAESFDAIILDPPKFAPTAAQAERAARGYKDINLLAFKLLRPGGLLFTFSCSGGISADLFQKIVAGAALDAGVQGALMVEHLAQGPDHPVALNFPEGAYLKGLVCQVTG